MLPDLCASVPEADALCGMKADRSEQGVNCGYVLISTVLIILRDVLDVNITDSFEPKFCYIASFSSQGIEELDRIAPEIQLPDLTA